jgi:hypothetical protein
MIAIGITATPIFVRLARGQVIAVKSEDCVEAVRTVGNPPWRVLARHIAPNIAPPVIVQATLAVAAAIIAQASLSFLGLGQQPPAPSWGSMLNIAQRFLVHQGRRQPIAGMTPCLRAQSAFAPDALTIGTHLPRSCAMTFAKAAGAVGGARSKPCAVSFSRASAPPSARVKAACSFSTISSGVSAGATKPNQVFTS